MVTRLGSGPIDPAALRYLRPRCRNTSRKVFPSIGWETRVSPSSLLGLVPRPRLQSRVGAGSPGVNLDAAVLLTCAGSVLAYLIETFSSALPGVLLLGSINLLLGCLVFLKHGGRRLTAVGIYYLAVGLFGGLAVLLLAGIDANSDPRTLLDVAAAISLSNVLTWLMVRRFGPTPVSTVPTWAPHVAGYCLRVGVVLIVAGISFEMAPPALRTLGRGFAAGGVSALAIAAAATPIRGTRARWVATWAAVCLGLLAYQHYVFSGFGRLLIVGLLAVMVLAFNAARPAHWHKAAVLIALIPGLTIGGLSRIDLADGEPTGISKILVERQGLGSVYSPSDTLGELVQNDRLGVSATMPRRYGLTLLESAVFWVPREVWAAKPNGFGAQLTQELRPELVASGHSMAALSHGEWYANFGWWGVLVLMPIATAVALRRMDRSVTRIVLSGRTLAIDDAMRLAVWLTIIGGLFTYVWGGTFTYFARVVTASMPLFVLSVIHGRKTLAITRRSPMRD